MLHPDFVALICSFWGAAASINLQPLFLTHSATKNSAVVNWTIANSGLSFLAINARSAKTSAPHQRRFRMRSLVFLTSHLPVTVSPLPISPASARLNPEPTTEQTVRDGNEACAIEHKELERRPVIRKWIASPLCLCQTGVACCCQLLSPHTVCSSVTTPVTRTTKLLHPKCN